MRRLAFIAAASLAFIAISEPPSAEARKGSSKCSSGCYDKIAEKYGRPWSYGDLAPADQRSFLKCSNKCKEARTDREIQEYEKRNPPKRWCYVKPEIKCSLEICDKTCKRKTGDKRSCTNERGRVLCTN